MSLRPRLLAAFASGLGLLVAYPPIDQGWVALIAIAPLLWALHGVGARRGALLGACAGLGFFGVLLYWISYFGYAAWAGLMVIMVGSWALFGALASRMRGAAGRILGAPLLFTGAEMLRSRFPFGGFTWGSLGSSQHAGGPTVHLARWLGMFGVTLALACVNALIAEMLRTRVRGLRAASLLIASSIVLLPGAIPIGLAGSRSSTMDVVAVQGNVPRERFTGVGRRGRVGPEDTVIVDNHRGETAKLIGSSPPDLIVWPENSFDRDPRLSPDLFNPVVDLIRVVDAPLLLGAILDAGTTTFTNSNLLVSQSGEIVRRYDKRHLVPFGEYVPLELLRKVVPALDRELPYEGLPGRAAVVFDVNGRKVGSVICFESTYPELVRDEVNAGAQVIVVTTNNASMGTSPAARQHLAMSQMRAIESGKAVVHDAIAGISAIIAPDGRIVERAPLFTPALLRASVPLTNARTPYTRFGSWIEIGFGLGALVVAASALLRRRGPVERGGE